jgi:hypothetical protein
VLKKPELKRELENLGLQILDLEGPAFQAYLGKLQTEIGNVVSVLKSEK